MKGLSAGDLMETPQIRMDEARAAELKIAPKIFTASCQINWNKPVSEIYNLIRGLSPYPAAFSFLEGKKVKIFKTEIMNTLPSVAAGEFETDKKTFLYFAQRLSKSLLRSISLALLCTSLYPKWVFHHYPVEIVINRLLCKIRAAQARNQSHPRLVQNIQVLARHLPRRRGAHPQDLTGVAPPRGLRRVLGVADRCGLLSPLRVARCLWRGRAALAAAALDP